MWYLWILTKEMIMLCLSLPTTKAYSGVHRSGNSMKEHTRKTYIVNQTSDPKRVESYNQIKMCMYMDIWGGYMMDIYGGQPNPTMLLENISLFF
jgi:hypothetical protein